MLQIFKQKLTFFRAGGILMWNIKTLITDAAKLCWNKVMKVTNFVKKKKILQFR